MNLGPIPGAMEFKHIGAMSAQDGASTYVDLSDVDIFVVSLQIIAHKQPTFIPVAMLREEGYNFFTLTLREGANIATTTINLVKTEGKHTVTAKLWYSDFWKASQAVIQFDSIRFL